MVVESNGQWIVATTTTMKRPNRSGGFTVVDKETPICLPVNNEDGKLVCKKRLGCLQTLLDNLGEEEDGILHDGDGGCGSLVLGEKKRRLRLDQVKALEKNFEVDNKLEPEMKVKLAEELGLQPRQVAVWFQNRRARWKTKQLDRDYGVLKAEYESLKLDHEALRSTNEALLARIKEMKTKVEDGSSSVKEGTLQIVKNEMSMKTTEEKEMAVKENDVEGEEGERSLPALKYKDRSSDSDTSAILNDDGSGGISSSSPSGVMSNPPHHLHRHHHPDQQQQLQMCFIGNDCTSSSPFSLLEDSDRDIRGNNYLCNSSSEKQMLTVEEQIGHDFLNGGGGGGGNSIFSDEQVPTPPWYYCSDHWKWN